MVWLVARRSRHLHQALLQVRIVLLVGRVELFDIEFLENVLHDDLTPDDLLSVLVLDLTLLSILLAVGDAVRDLKEFFGDLANGEALALFDLST